MPSPTSALDVRVTTTPEETGRAAAAAVAEALRSTLARKGSARVVFAAAPSQLPLLTALRGRDDIDWTRVTAFHMDEYIGLAPDAPQRFGPWLRRALFDHVPLADALLIDPGPQPGKAARGYARLLDEGPLDLVCLGIGVNGHLAFNDPPVADLDDPLDVKVVELDGACRRQQVDDDCFEALEQVPTHAVTLTVPRLLRAERLVGTVLGRRKSAAVRDAVCAPVGAACPATALRTHPRCTLHVDTGAAALLPEEVVHGG
ncbi:6-phosphogluconolactonase [Streptomyces sp. NPDC050560]|uniref:6-phosphogluconolactonase n=1 Tax=Streptomyces sp. NPDC050560 TaxID=3365630 RepID=UPI0037A8EF04